VSASTIDHLRARSHEEVRVQRIVYSTMTALLTLVVGLAVTDALKLTNVYGVRTTDASATGGGYTLVVDHASVTRPGLATPFRIEVRADAGFDQPITLGVDRHYLAMWDENGLSPAPAEETVRGEWVDWTFDPPDGDVLLVSFDARAEPAVQSGRDGAVQLLIDGDVVAEVGFHTRVMP
jgi:hypothetical protein